MGCSQSCESLIFFLEANDLLTKDFSTSSPKLTNELYTIINENYRLKDGSWGKNESLAEFQRVNGSMKMVTALEAAGIRDLENPESLIDLCLKATNDKQACDHFNIICVLHFCSRITSYRKDEIVEFALNRLRMYEKHYWPEVGVFHSIKTDLKIIFTVQKYPVGIQNLIFMEQLCCFGVLF